MDHRPYEDWLLDDERLTAEQERALRAHLRDCPECAALDRSNMALRAAPMSGPVAGFAARFQVRLAVERRVQRIVSILSAALVLVVGIGVLLVFLPPYLAYLSLSPTQFVVTLISPLINVVVTLYTTTLSGRPLPDAVLSFVPPYMWILSLALLGSSAGLWLFASRKSARFPRGSRRAESVASADKVS